MRALENDSTKAEAGRPSTGTKSPGARRTRGGSAYQHSLSARGIKSSGRARSCSDEDLLSSLERLDRATRRLPDEDEAEEGGRRSRAFGRHGGGAGRTDSPSYGGPEQRIRGPRFSW